MMESAKQTWRMLEPAAVRPAVRRRKGLCSAIVFTAVLMVIAPYRERIDARALRYAFFHDPFLDAAGELLLLLPPIYAPSGTSRGQLLNSFRYAPLSHFGISGYSRQRIGEGLGTGLAPEWFWQYRRNWNLDWVQWDVFEMGRGWAGSVMSHVDLPDAAVFETCMADTIRFGEVGDCDHDGRPEVLLAWTLTNGSRAERTRRYAFVTVGRHEHELRWACEAPGAVSLALVPNEPDASGWPSISMMDRPIIWLPPSPSEDDQSALSPDWVFGDPEYTLFEFAPDQRCYVPTGSTSTGASDPDRVPWEPGKHGSVVFPADRPLDEVLAEVLPSLRIPAIRK